MSLITLFATDNRL